MSTKVGYVYETKDYWKFKHLLGNRSIEQSRVNAVIESIQAVGYVMSPIIVNEKMEIIDGQARRVALEKLGLPVHYVVAMGAGVDECIQLNIKQTNWKMEDYINCYAELGNTSYKYLKILYDRYGKTLTLKPIAYALRGASQINEFIKAGKFTCTAEQYSNGQKALEYINLFDGAIGNKAGYRSNYFVALAFCYDCPAVDNKKMLEMVKKHNLDIVPVVSVTQAVEVLEKIYNTRARTKVYILTEYRKDYEKKKQEYRNSYYNGRKDNAVPDVETDLA